MTEEEFEKRKQEYFREINNNIFIKNNKENCEFYYYISYIVSPYDDIIAIAYRSRFPKIFVKSLILVFIKN